LRHVGLILLLADDVRRRVICLGQSLLYRDRSETL
jgi:hypothetical protein